MRKFERHVRLALCVAVIVAVGAVWMTALGAETDAGKPSLKQMMEKPSKGTPELERPAAGIPDDALGRGTPRSSVRGFLSAAKDRNYVQAAEYLDLRNLPSGLTQAHGPELARQLRIVLDQTLWIDVDALSTDPEGDQAENLPAVRERVGRIMAEGKTYDLFLQRVPRGDGVYIWKFAEMTVEQIPQLYQQFGYGQLERFLPGWMFDVSVLGINLWLWAAVLALAIVLFPVAMLVTRLFTVGLRVLHPQLAEQFERLFSGPISLLIWTVMVRNAATVLGSSIALSALSQARTVQVIGLAWLFMRVVDFIVQRAGSN